ncbi:cytochrome p450 [Moniliophthora roreri MCA 2997]|uniref:Cytochrome p450 n=1 Tax=Moniliophthora roreri (strain MCA 2997) TaxID=1381753 RepID=V2WC01_MONRO|nr:cytochrome p450 [Moniliophthora roreri MCA 2997]
MSGSKPFAEPPVAVVTKDAALQPPAPKGLKYIHLMDPDTLVDDNAHYPVLTIASYSFWALSYTDNREALAVLAYDEKNILVRQWDFTNVRYLVSITYNPDRRNVVFLGQANHKVTVPIDQLLEVVESAVAVVTKDAALQPPPPKGLNYTHLTNPDTLDEDNTHYPVLTIANYSYWALSYNDNREALAVLAYDEKNVLVRQWEFKANHKVTVPIDQLQVGPTIAIVIQDANLQPTPPEGLNYTHLKNTVTLEEDNAHYPVLTIGEYAYWALSYDDNREGLAILAYDQDNKLDRQWEFTGARYLVSISYKPGDSNVVFIGQAGNSNVLQLRNRPWHTFVEWKKSYGDIVYLRLFNQDAIVLNSAKVAGDLLNRRASNYSQRIRMPVIDHSSGGMNIVFMNPGVKLRSMRRAAHEALNIRVSTRYYPMQMRASIQLAMNMLDSPEKHHHHIERQGYFKLDIPYYSAITIFLCRFLSLKVTSVIYNDPSHERIAELTDFLRYAVDAALPGRYAANHVPILEYLPDFLSKWRRDAKEKYRVYTDKFLSYFLSIKEATLQKREMGSSFCSVLVDTREQHGLDDLESAWLAAIVYLAAFETTESTFNWLILAMIAFPDAQRKAQEELDSVIGRERIPTLDDMDSLPYMRAVVMRWRPAPPMGILHASLEDDFYEGYYIPKGSLVIPNVLAMNHDEATYGPNPDEFRPERFLNEDGTHKLSPPDTKDEGHYTFGFGYRICPGRHLAFNALFTFAVTLWAMHLEAGEDSDGISTEDEESGISSRARKFSVSTKARFPEALEILNLAKEEWALAE